MKKIFAIIIAIFLVGGCATTKSPFDILKQAEHAGGARPDGKKSLYLCTARNGGASGAMDSLDITGAGNPNTYDLVVGDAAIVVMSTGYYLYIFNSTSTETESDPTYIRPDDYSTAGVWELSDPSRIIVNTLDTDHDGEITDEEWYTDKQDIVTEGSLTDSVIISGDIKDYTIGAVDLNNYQDWSAKTIILPNTIFDFTPSSDHSWQGNEGSVTAGESITLGNIIYEKYDTDGPRAFAYNADSSDSDNDTYRPCGIALESKTAGNALSIGIGHGVFRDDSYTFVNAQDEGKPIFAGETDGAVTLTRPSGSGDHIIHLGNLKDEDEIEFNFGAITDVVVP